VSDAIVHAVDLFTTLARLGGAEVPKDRTIDGVDQLAFLLGRQERSNREGFVVYIEDQLRAVKWRDWKWDLVWQPDAAEGAPVKLETPVLFNLVQDPKEETDVSMHHAWVAEPLFRLAHDFRESLKRYTPIPPGAPDPYHPPK
jgi:arylsulfatase